MSTYIISRNTNDKPLKTAKSLKKSKRAILLNSNSYVINNNNNLLDCSKINLTSSSSKSY